MITPITYYAPSEVTSPRLAYAFARGCNGEISDDPEYLFRDRPAALFGSPSRWPILRQAQAAGVDYFYADHAYFGRGRYFRITKNRYQHDGRGDADPERYRVSCGREIKPWRTRGRHVLVCPNSDIYFGLHGVDGPAWLHGVKQTLSSVTNRPIHVRWKTDARHRPIAFDLANAWAVVVFSSASAIDALIAGVPVFTLAPFAATARMGLSDLRQIDHPIYPSDRESFLAVLANNQWTLPEIFAGKAWKTLSASEASCAA